MGYEKHIEVLMHRDLNLPTDIVNVIAKYAWGIKKCSRCRDERSQEWFRTRSGHGSLKTCLGCRSKRLERRYMQYYFNYIRPDHGEEGKIYNLYPCILEEVHERGFTNRLYPSYIMDALFMEKNNARRSVEDWLCVMANFCEEERFPKDYIDVEYLTDIAIAHFTKCLQV